MVWIFVDDISDFSDEDTNSEDEDDEVTDVVVDADEVDGAADEVDGVEEAAAVTAADTDDDEGVDDVGEANGNDTAVDDDEVDEEVEVRCRDVTVVHGGAEVEDNCGISVGQTSLRWLQQQGDNFSIVSASTKLTQEGGRKGHETKITFIIYKCCLHNLFVALTALLQ